MQSSRSGREEDDAGCVSMLGCFIAMLGLLPAASICWPAALHRGNWPLGLPRGRKPCWAGLFRAAAPTRDLSLPINFSLIGRTTRSLGLIIIKIVKLGFWPTLIYHSIPGIFLTLSQIKIHFPSSILFTAISLVESIHFTRNSFLIVL